MLNSALLLILKKSGHSALAERKTVLLMKSFFSKMFSYIFVKELSIIDSKGKGAAWYCVIIGE